MSFESKMKKKGNDTISQFAKNPYYTGPKKQPFPLWAKISIPSVSVALTSLAVVLAISVASSSGTEIGLWERHALNYPQTPVNSAYIASEDSYRNGVADFSSRILAAASADHAQLQISLEEMRAEAGNPRGVDEINFVLTPLSLLNTLYMLYDGASIETRGILERVLPVDETSFNHLEETKKAIHNVTKDVTLETGKSLFSNVSQAVFINTDERPYFPTRTTMKEEYLDLLTNYYYADVFQGDMGSPEMWKLEQQYYYEKTNGTFQLYSDKCAVRPYPVPETWMYNSSFITSGWGVEFQEAQFGDFTNYDGSVTKDVPYIQSCDFTGVYRESQDYGIVSVPLLEGFHFDILLPKEGADYPGLSEDSFRDLLTLSAADEYDATICLKMPVFEASSGLYSLNPFEKLGISPEVFDRSNIHNNFPNILESGADFCPAFAFGAVLRVDRDGIFGKAGMYNNPRVIPSNNQDPGSSRPRIDFTVNRPFIYSVSNKDGIPLFAGGFAKMC